MTKDTGFFPFSDKNILGWREYLMLFLFSFALFVPGINTIPPVDRDEPRFAQATKQMIESGNYIDIRFQKDARYKKPIGIYWLQAVSVKLFSPHKLNEIWAYRIPSLAGAIASVLLTAVLGSLLFGAFAGFIAALMMASSLLLNVEARLAKTDAVLLAFVLASQYALARAYLGKANRYTPFIFWTAQAAAFLIKGPVLLMITVAELLYLRLTEKNLGWIKDLKFAWGIPLFMLLVSPWFIAITFLSSGSFIAESAWHDLLSKIWQGQDRGILPPGLHLLVFPMMFFPASLLAMLAVPVIWKIRHEKEVRFCLGWLLIPWFIFELSLTKLPHYVLPLYPAIALLTAGVVTRGLASLLPQNKRWVIAIAYGAWLTAGIALASGIVLLPWVSDGKSQSGAVMAGLVILFMMGSVLIVIGGNKIYKGILFMAGSVVAISLMVFGLVIPSMGNLWLSRQIVQVAEKVKPCGNLKIASAAYNEPSLIFLAGTETVITEYGEGIADRMRQDSCLLGLIDSEHEKAFLEKFKYSNDKALLLARFNGPNLGRWKKTALSLYLLADNQK